MSMDAIEWLDKFSWIPDGTPEDKEVVTTVGRIRRSHERFAAYKLREMAESRRLEARNLEASEQCKQYVNFLHDEARRLEVEADRLEKERKVKNDRNSKATNLSL
jgi:hypothetical protein